MPKALVKKGTASFQTRGRLLQELGERLVAKADVALLELIKNAYDADATECRVIVEPDRVEIVDDGHGMTEREFLDKWMHIATPEKQRVRVSRRYHRRVTGSKGIGRFAVRFLGRKLRLETTADDPKANGSRMLLTTTFDWKRIDASSRLHTVKIAYEVGPAPADRKTGTRLIIGELRSPGDIQLSKEQRTELLSIVDPYSGLETGGFGRSGTSTKEPGFRVILPQSTEEGEADLVSAVLDNAYARLTVEHDGTQAKVIIRHKDGRTLLRRKFPYPSHIKSGFFADIRYCPRRAGMFQGTSIDGRSVWRWLRRKGGIGIVDHGFRIRPYGFEDDDWLNLGLDSGYNRREWRADIMKRLYPMPSEASSQPKLNPMLYLPNFHQLLGAVFVHSSQEGNSRRPTDLTPSMDREGFVENEAFRDLTNLIRAGLEMLAYADHAEQRRIEEEQRKKQAQELRADLREATAYIKTVPGLSPHDRQTVVAQFTKLSKQLEDVEEYQQVVASKLDMMAMLGVMAGFVTHEMQRILNGLDRLLARLTRIASRDKEAEAALAEVKKTREALVGQLDYSTAFIGSVQNTGAAPEPVNAKASVSLALRQFQQFTDDRGISVEVEIEDGLLTPPLPRALYNGVVLNLFTNALKATVGGATSAPEPRVVVKAWNDQKRHVLEVADTGVGIPPRLQKRIWDPLFTTTSAQDYNPLGSGMGLGLTLIKKIVTDANGKIVLVDPPPGFRTCFRVEFLRKGVSQ